jgi:hypothetical protein
MAELLAALEVPYKGLQHTMLITNIPSDGIAVVRP